MDNTPSSSPFLPNCTSTSYPFHEDASILSGSEWNELYPRDQYQKRPNFALHFLFALGQKLETISSYIASLKAKNPERLIQGDAENHNLTPLHIAAMKANAEGAKALLGAFGTKDEKLAAIRKKDDFGWTPLHHAACTSNTLFQLFIAEGGDPETKTSTAPSPKDLRHLSGREISVSSSKSLFARVGEPRSLIPVASLNLNEKISLFGPSFVQTDYPIFPTRHLKALWQQGSDENNKAITGGNFMQTINRPSLIIQECKELSHVVPHSLELVANQDIPAMSFITEYTGLIGALLEPRSLLEAFNEEFAKSGEYALDGVYSRNVGNEAKFSNMGFPNCFLNTDLIDGVERKFILSLRPIKKGEAILWSYGPKMYPLVLGRQILLGKEEMEKFYKEHRDIPRETLNALMRLEWAKRAGLPAPAEDFINFNKLRSMLYFPLDCPTALLHLHFREIIPYTVFANSIYTNPAYLSWLKTCGYETPMFMCIIKILQQTDTVVKKNRSFEPLIKEFVLSKLEKATLISILKGLDLIGKTDQLQTTNDLIQRIVEVEALLSTYEWKTDPDHPFSFERMVQVSLEYYKKLPGDVALKILDLGLKNTDEGTEPHTILKEVQKRI